MSKYSRAFTADSARLRERCRGRCALGGRAVQGGAFGFFKGQLAFPTTAFYDSKGELAYVKQGGYRDEEDLVADIKRYAR